MLPILLALSSACDGVTHLGDVARVGHFGLNLSFTRMLGPFLRKPRAVLACFTVGEMTRGLPLRFEELALLAYNARMKVEPLEVEHLFSDAGGQGVLRFKGPLITQNLPEFQNAIRRENAATVILDLTEVPYIDSSGLGSLVSAYVSGHKSGRRMALTGVNARIFNLLEITKLEQLFLIFPSLSAALDGLSNPGMA